MKKLFMLVIFALLTITIKAQAIADKPIKKDTVKGVILKEPSKNTSNTAPRVKSKEQVVLDSVKVLPISSKVKTDTTTIKGCMGLTFGQSKVKVKQIIASKGGVLDVKYSKPDAFIYDNIKFATRKTKFIACHFVNDKLYECVIYLKADLETNTVDLYKTIKNELNSKYYKSDVDFEQYKYPYEKNDGFTETAISLGKATFTTYWFENSFEKFSDNNNYIILEITSDMYIKIIYHSAEFGKGAQDKLKQEKTLDY